MTWGPLQTIIVPVDFSEESFAAVDTALAMAAAPAALHLIHVLGEMEMIEPGTLWDTISDDTRKRNATQAIRKRLHDTRYASVHVEVLIGDPGRAISDYCQRVGADLIVMPSHGRRGLTRLLIGSVAERVVRLAHCPVLVLRN